MLVAKKEYIWEEVGNILAPIETLCEIPKKICRKFDLLPIFGNLAEKYNYGTKYFNIVRESFRKFY